MGGLGEHINVLTDQDGCHTRRCHHHYSIATWTDTDTEILISNKHVIFSEELETVTVKYVHNLQLVFLI